ncbi:MAG: hypothetical protein ACD_79C00378G0001, partial [uncultured bacterium]
MTRNRHSGISSSNTDSSYNLIKNNTIVSNCIYASWDSAGVSFSHSTCTNNVIMNNVILKNNLVNNNTQGIYHEGANAIIYGNIVGGYDTNGINPGGLATNTIVSFNTCFGSDPASYFSGIATNGSSTVIRENTVFANRHGIRLLNNADSNIILNNTTVKNLSYGIYLNSANPNFTDNNKIYNNISAYNATSGIFADGGTAGNAADFNFYYGNGTDISNNFGETHSIVTAGVTSFGFNANDSGTADATSSTTMILDAGQGWTANMWQGLGVKITISGTDYWAGIISNTSDKLFIYPPLGATPANGDAFIITDFTPAGTTLTAETPIGQGCRADKTTEPGTVNIGAVTDYVKNTTDTKVFGSLQSAHDDAGLSASDTVTSYSIDEVASGTIGATITDN